MKENFSLSPCGPYTAVMHQQATEARMDIDAEMVFRVLEVLWMEKRSELKASIMPPLVPAAGRKQNESAKRGPRISRIAAQSTFVSWRQTMEARFWRTKSRTIRRRAGLLRPRTFQLKTVQLCSLIGNRVDLRNEQTEGLASDWQPGDTD